MAQHLEMVRLMRAVFANDLEGVRWILERGHNANWENIKHGMPLHVAARKGHLSIAQLLLQHGADVDHKDISCRTPLSIAVSRRDLSMVKLLLENRANPNASILDFTFHKACKLRDAEFCRLLLAFGAEINPKEKEAILFFEEAKTPLQVACRKGCEKTIKLLARKSGFPNFSLVELKEDERLRSAWLSRYCTKMSIAGMDIGTRPLHLFVLRLLRHDIVVKPEEEIAKMKKDAICMDMSMYDVLTLRVDELVTHFRFCPKRNALRSSGFEEKYPEYAEILLWKIEDTEWNLALQDICHTFFNDVYPQLPYLCVDHIQSYLSDADLRILFCTHRPKDFYNY